MVHVQIYHTTIHTIGTKISTTLSADALTSRHLSALFYVLLKPDKSVNVPIFKHLNTRETNVEYLLVFAFFTTVSIKL